MRRRSESEEQDIVTKWFLDDFFDSVMTLMKMRLDFLITDLSQHFEIY